MKVFGRIRFKALPEKRVWPLARAEGFVDGGALALSVGRAAIAEKRRVSNLEAPSEFTCG